MNNIIGLKPSQPFTLCEPITVDLMIAATVLVLKPVLLVDTTLIHSLFAYEDKWSNGFVQITE